MKLSPVLTVLYSDGWYAISNWFESEMIHSCLLIRHKELHVFVFFCLTADTFVVQTCSGVKALGDRSRGFEFKSLSKLVSSAPGASYHVSS